MQEPQVYHVENYVQYNQQQLEAQLQNMQTMIQAIHLHYVAAPKTTYQAYGFQGKYGGNNGFRGRGGRGYQRRGNWRRGHGGRASRNLNNYCWTHKMWDHPCTNWRNTSEGHKKNAVWCNKILSSKRNYSWQDGLVPASNSNVTDNTTSITSELLCRSIIDPTNHATIISKPDSGASNNYWNTEDIIFPTDITDISNGHTLCNYQTILPYILPRQDKSRCQRVSFNK